MKLQHRELKTSSTQITDILHKMFETYEYELNTVHPQLKTVQDRALHFCYLCGYRDALADSMSLTDVPDDPYELLDILAPMFHVLRGELAQYEEVTNATGYIPIPEAAYSPRPLPSRTRD